MKVVLLAPLPPPTGGIAGWTERMQAAQLKNGWSVEVVDEKLIGNRNSKGGGYKKNVITELNRSKKIWKGLKKHLKEDDVKVVQACIPATTGALLREIVSANITHRFGKPFIVHFRCTVPNMINSRLTFFLLKTLVNKSDCVFCLNRQTINYVKKIVPKSDCRYIPNFVSEGESHKKEHYSSRIKRVLYTGRVLESKGCGLIIDIAKKMPDIQFEMIGKVLMKVDNIPDNVILSGERDKAYISEKLKSADLFLFLSRFSGEGFSNSLAEAMAYSLPCIVTDWAANKNMIGKSGGLVFDQPTVDEIVQAIYSLDGNVSMRAQMGESNYVKVINCFSQRAVTDQYVDNYERLLRKKRVK